MTVYPFSQGEVAEVKEDFVETLFVEPAATVPPMPSRTAEVDLVVERDDGSVVALEVKAGTRVPGRDLAGLRTIRDALGEALSPALPCAQAAVPSQRRTASMFCPSTGFGLRASESPVGGALS